MAVNAYLTFFEAADGESTQKGHEKSVEVRDWAWSIDADSSWTKGGGASVGKPNPGAFTWQHVFDTSSTVIMEHICTGTAFPKVEVQMVKAGGAGLVGTTYFTMLLEGVYVTSTALSASEEGVVQAVTMVFKTVSIEYRTQDPNGRLGTSRTFSWDIPAGTSSAGTVPAPGPPPPQ